MNTVPWTELLNLIKWKKIKHALLMENILFYFLQRTIKCFEVAAVCVRAQINTEKNIYLKKTNKNSYTNVDVRSLRLYL